MCVIMWSLLDAAAHFHKNSAIVCFSQSIKWKFLGVVLLLLYQCTKQDVAKRVTVNKCVAKTCSG